MVFVVTGIEVFDASAPVVRALRAAGWRVPVVVTPVRDVSHVTSDGTFDLARVPEIWAQLEAQGFAPEPIVRVEDEAERIRSFGPRAVFFPRPYAFERHESLDPKVLGVPAHYLNYGFDICPTMPGIGYGDLSFYGECEAVYSENEYYTNQLIRAGVDPGKIVKSGQPILDRWDVDWPRAEQPTILWCPWWSTRWDDTATELLGRQA